MREKLIEVLCSAYIPIMNGNVTVGEFSIAINEAEVLADHLIANGVTIPVRCKDCKHWLKDYPGCTDAIGRCEWANYMVGCNGYCVYGERRTDDK